MKHPMRRAKQQLSKEEAFALLNCGTEGVLSLVDEDRNPYGVPLNYVLDGEVIYFHCAKAGRKLDCLRANPFASFCVISAADIVPEEFTTYFRSVIASGEICVIKDEERRKYALQKLGLKYNDNYEACEAEIEKGLAHCEILAMQIDEISAKEAIELVKAKTLG